jgi:hypothetical protein
LFVELPRRITERFRMRLTRRLVPALLSLLLVACSDENPMSIPENRYLNSNTPASLLEDFRRSWVYRDIEHYETLFADDFVFYFDGSTLEENPALPEFWTRSEELNRVGELFASEEISDIRLLLEYDPVPEPVEDVGREQWLRIVVTDVMLQIDRTPLPGESEGTTYLVEDQVQHFYLRKGKTEDDTLPSSPTSDKYFIVSWRDLGPESWRDLDPLSASMPATWGRLKALFR